MHSTIVVELYLPSVVSFAMAFSACCGQSLVPILLSGQCQPSRAYSWVRPDVCPQTSTEATENCRMLLVLSPEKFLLVSRASNQISCLPPAIAGVAVELMYAVISYRAKVSLK